MTAEEIVADAIGQLNLVLWMTQPLPGEYSIRPLLKEAGYRLLAIAPAMPLALELRERVQATGLPCRQQPEPDALLGAGQDREFAMVECKRSMFGPDSRAAEQARGLLLQTGEQLNVALALPVGAPTSSHLVYIAEHCDFLSPAEGLADIAQQLHGEGLAVAPAGVLCLQARDDGIYLLDEYEPGQIPERLHRAVGRGVRVQEAVEGEEAMPLLLVPWDPDVDQASAVTQVGKQVLCQRLLTSLVTRVGKLAPGGHVEAEFDDLLNEATFDLYERWRIRNTEVQRSLRRFCGKLLHEALGDVSRVTLEPLGGNRRGRRIVVADDQAKEAAIDAITRCARGVCPEIPGPDPQRLPFPEDE